MHKGSVGNFRSSIHCRSPEQIVGNTDNIHDGMSNPRLYTPICRPPLSGGTAVIDSAAFSVFLWLLYWKSTKWKWLSHLLNTSMAGWEREMEVRNREKVRQLEKERLGESESQKWRGSQKKKDILRGGERNISGNGGRLVGLWQHWWMMCWIWPFQTKGTGLLSPKILV